jgi:hypothetical protein
MTFVPSSTDSARLTSDMEAQTNPAQTTSSQPGKSIQMGAWLGGCLPVSVALLSTKWK